MVTRQLLILVDVMIVIIITLVFFQTVYKVVDDTHHQLLISSKDVPLFHDAAMASPHNIIKAKFIIPENTRLVLSNLDLSTAAKTMQKGEHGSKIGLVEAEYTDDWSLAYPYILNKNIANKIIDTINQPVEEKKGEYIISIQNE